MPEVTGKRPNNSLRGERLRHRWSQQEVADRIGTTPNNVSRWELGLTTPGPYFRSKLCQLFGKPFSELGWGVDESTSSHQSATGAGVPSSPIWMVPFRRNPFFTGREDILTRLHNALHSQKVVSSMPVYAISGLGGIGKTQVVIEYAYRSREDYQAILWVRADSPETLLGEIGALAQALDLPEKEASDQSRLTRAIKRWFQNQNGWLLILDNVEDLEILEEVLPPVHQGHVLLTSRALATGALAQRIDLEPLDTQDGVVLLLRRAKRIAPDASVKEICMQDYECANEVAMSMGGLPLALDQAGAYLEETGCSLSSYLERYRTQRTALLSLRGGTTHSDHPASVVMTFSLTIGQVERMQPVATELLRCCSFLHPDAIPEELLLDGADALGPLLKSTAPDPLALDGAIRVLLRFSLVRRNPDNRTLTIHRLVQGVVRDMISEEMQRQWAERIVRALNSVFPNVDFEQGLQVWPRCQRLLPQVYASAKLVEYWQLTVPEAARLLNQAGLYCIYRNQYAQAEALLKQVLDIWHKTLGEMHPDVAETLNYLALLYHQRGRYAQAQELYQQALTILEYRLGPAHPTVAVSLQCLATCYHYQGKFAQVTPLYQRALAILEQTAGPTHHDVADNLNDLARLYREQGRGAEAEALYQRALALYQQALGAAHPYGAVCLTNMGLLYSEQGREFEAEELLHHALHIFEQALGPNHPYVALSLNGLALLAGRRHRFAQARALGERALAIREQVYGPEHPLVAESLTTLGVLAAQQRKPTQASSLFERALAMLERVVGPAHPLVAQCLSDWADILMQRGRYMQARPLYQQACAIWERTLGHGHPKAVAGAARCAELARYLKSEGKAVAGKARSQPLPMADPQKKTSAGTLGQGEGGTSAGPNFFTERCSLDPQARSRASDLWQAYQHWKQERENAMPLSRRAFAQRLQALGCKPVRTKTCRLWRGIALKDQTGEA